MECTSLKHTIYWDIVKGVGIIAIVLGHCGEPLDMIAFVYLFHLTLFFFVTAFLYNEKKYGDRPFYYFSFRLSRVWPKYVFYSLIFVLFHNFLAARGLSADQTIYDHSSMLSSFLVSMVFACPEQTQGALWFLPVWLLSAGLFGGSVWFGRSKVRRIYTKSVKKILSTRFDTLKISENKTNLDKQANDSAVLFKFLISGIICGLLGFIGIFLNMRGIALNYNLHTGLLALPIYYIAWLMRTLLSFAFKNNRQIFGHLSIAHLGKYFKIACLVILCLILGFILRFINTHLHIYIDLANMSIPGFYYYPISLIGICFVLTLSGLVEKITLLNRIFAFFGKYSFDIMALHFLLFKLMDWVYASRILKSLPDEIYSFPSYFSPRFWPVYLFCGLFIPALFGFFTDKIFRFCFGKNNVD